MQVVYEDNHVIIVAKRSGEIVQGDKTGDLPLSETVKAYIKERYQKPGAVFLGVVHRLDRPVWGLVVFARTSKALSRLNDMFREGAVHKTYWALVEMRNEQGGARNAGARGLQDDGEWHTLEHWLVRNEKQNKSYVVPEPAQKGGGNGRGTVQQAKHAVLKYRVLGHSERYTLVEVRLLTGRHHQIRCQLSAMGRPIKGDLKYGARRSNPDGSISLLARRVEFVHPVSKQPVCVEAPLPDDRLWQAFADVETHEADASATVGPREAVSADTSPKT